MKSCYYPVTDRETDQSKHMICVYDETALCSCCEEPVNNASISHTGLCGPCDNGKERSRKCRVNMRKDPNNPRPKPWHNLKEQFVFDSKRDAFAKMDELDKQGISGWPIQLQWFRDGKYDKDGLRADGGNLK